MLDIEILSTSTVIPVPPTTSSVTTPETPPPVRPKPAVTPVMVPEPPPRALIVPSAAITIFVPALTPPITVAVGGNKLTVCDPPDNVKGPPLSPVPDARLKKFVRSTTS